MNQILNWLQGHISVLVYIGVLLFPAIVAVGKKLQEQKETRRVTQERERRRHEVLRTGRANTPEPAAPRPALSPAAARQQRLQELAEKRRAQLEEIRRRREGAPAARTSAPPRPNAPSRPTARPQAPRPSPQPQQRTSAQRPQARPAPPRPTTPVQRAPARRPQPVPRAQPSIGVRRAPRPAPSPAIGAERRDVASLSSATEAPVHRTEVGSRAARALRESPAPGSHLFGSRGASGIGRLDLRRAIVLAELLGPPVSMRG